MEGLRVDPAHEIGPFRLNQVVAAVVFACSLVVLLRLRRRSPRLKRRVAGPARGVWPSTAGRGGTITRTVQPPPVVSSNVIVPPTPQARSRMASTPRCMPPRCNSSSLRAAAVVGDAELDAALLERARGDVDARAAGVLDGVRRRLLRDAVERDLCLPVECVDGRGVDHDLDLVRFRELTGELAERRREAVVAQRDRLERERQRAQRADDAPAVLERAVERAEALVDLAGLDRVVRGLDDQADAGDALLRPVVQRQRQPAALALLDAQEPVGEPSALALAQLGLDPQGLGEREQARVVRGAHRGGREHAQLRALDGAEGRVGAAQHGQRAALQRGDGQRSDLDGAAVGRRRAPRPDRWRCRHRARPGARPARAVRS